MKETYNVFVVDDEAVFREMIKDELTASNPRLEVFTFKNGEECVENIDFKPDIVILDHKLNSNVPNAKSGLEILDLIRERHPSVHVIVLSGQLLPDVTFDFIIKKNVDKYIVKGDTALSEVAETIENIIQEIG